MNVVELNPIVPEALRAKLAQLPEFAPPPALWLRIAQERALRRSRRPWLLPAALAAGFALAAWLGAGLVQRPDDAGLAPFVAQSRALEAELLRARSDAGAHAALVAVESELARVDAALQAAYDRGAPAAELEQLWQERTAMLRTLVAAYRSPASVVRI